MDRHRITAISYEDRSCTPLGKVPVRLYWTFEIPSFLMMWDVRHF